MRQKVVSFAALAESGFGLLLLANPPLIARLLLAREISGLPITVGRLAGLGLIIFGVACWARRSSSGAARGMLAYSALAMILLIVIGLRGVAGVLLWPAVVVHAAIALLLWMSR